MNIAILVFSILAILVVVYFLMKKKPIVTTTTTTIAQAPITLDVRFENVLTSYGQSYDYIPSSVLVNTYKDGHLLLTANSGDVTISSVSVDSPDFSFVETHTLPYTILSGTNKQWAIRFNGNSVVGTYTTVVSIEHDIVGTDCPFTFKAKLTVISE